MDEIYENKLIHYRRIENIVKNFEENEAKINESIEAIRRKSKSDNASIGPANDILRYFYTLEQQYQSDDKRLLCLSILATLILAQLLGGDLTDIKTEIFLPLIGILSQNQQHKEFRIIFLDRLHKKCPYTVPLYPKRQSTMNDKQYLEAIGYIEKQDGDQRRLETETEFLNRMNGLIRLFCKLLVSRGPPFDKDLAFAWKWFSDVLNLPPKSNITSVLIRVFLEEAGKMMMNVYQTQFPKIINAIQLQYLPRLEKQTSDDQMARLRLTLDNFHK
ncbi:unnamed protein product [Rotaria sp. Silwood1]|nr:unnamed protein product [Rotaria sp. Silwood1]